MWAEKEGSFWPFEAGELRGRGQGHGFREGDCWSCHMIDEKGNYGLYGADKEGISVG